MCLVHQPQLLEFLAVFCAAPEIDKTGMTTIGGATMLRQLHLLTIPTAISIAFFDATFFLIADIFGFTAREVILGVIAGAAGGMSVLAANLWQSARNVATQVTN